MNTKKFLIALPLIISCFGFHVCDVLAGTNPSGAMSPQILKSTRSTVVPKMTWAKRRENLLKQNLQTVTDKGKQLEAEVIKARAEEETAKKSASEELARREEIEKTLKDERDEYGRKLSEFTEQQEAFKKNEGELRGQLDCQKIAEHKKGLIANLSGKIVKTANACINEMDLAGGLIRPFTAVSLRLEGELQAEDHTIPQGLVSPTVYTSPDTEINNNETLDNDDCRRMNELYEASTTSEVTTFSDCIGRILASVHSFQETLTQSVQLSHVEIQEAVRTWNEIQTATIDTTEEKVYEARKKDFKHAIFKVFNVKLQRFSELVLNKIFSGSEQISLSLEKFGLKEESMPELGDYEDTALPPELKTFLKDIASKFLDKVVNGVILISHDEEAGTAEYVGSGIATPALNTKYGDGGSQQTSNFVPSGTEVEDESLEDIPELEFESKQ